MAQNLESYVSSVGDKQVSQQATDDSEIKFSENPSARDILDIRTLINRLDKPRKKGRPPRTKLKATHNEKKVQYNINKREI